MPEVDKQYTLEVTYSHWKKRGPARIGLVSGTTAEIQVEDLINKSIEQILLERHEKDTEVFCIYLGEMA
jgi:hypothetical protein